MIPSLISLLALLVVGVWSADLDIDACSAVSPDKPPVACYFPDWCKRLKTNQLIHANMLTKDEMKSCIAFVSFQQFTARKWLVTMQLAKSDEKKEISIKLSKLSTHNYFVSCKSNDGSTVTVDTGSLTKEIYQTIVRKDIMTCKFIVEGELTGLINKPGLRFTLVISGNPALEYSSYGNSIWSDLANTDSCDGSTLQFHSASIAKDQTSLRPLVEFNNVRCDIGSKLIAVQGGKPHDVTVECKGGSSYTITKKSGGVLNLLSPVACSAKTCTLCGEVTAFNSGTKPGWAPSNGNTCATLTCTGDRIQVPSSNSTVAKPYCKQFGDTGDFRWTIKYGSTELPFTEASCTTSVKCNDVQPLRVIASSSPIDPWAPKIACVDTNYHLAARASATSAWTPIDAVSCNPDTGEWRKVFPGGAQKKLLPTEEIKCLNDDEVEAAKDAAEQTDNDGSSTKSPLPADAGMSTAAIVSVAIVSVSVVILIAGFAFFAIRRKRREQAEIGEVDAKPPTPPVTADSDKQFGNEVSFSGNRATPSLKTPQPDPTAPKLKMKQIPEAKQLEEAVSVTAHPIPLKVEQYSGTSDKSTPPPPPPTADVDVSKKKVVDLLEQSVPSMSE